MALPTGLIKSQKGTSQAVRTVKQGARSSHPLCLSALTLKALFIPKVHVKIIYFVVEKWRFQALTCRLIPIQDESGWF